MEAAAGSHLVLIAVGSLYFRLMLSYREVEELRTARDLEVSYKTSVC